MRQLRRALNWLFKDLHGRKGEYVIVEAPNLPLIIFMVAIVLSIILYPGAVQKFFTFTAYASFVVWGWREMRSGRSRFRMSLGIVGLLAVVLAVSMNLGL